MSHKQKQKQKQTQQAEYVTLSGMIEHREPISLGGEAPPAGSYLILDRHVRPGRLSAKEVYLLGRSFTEGEHKKLYGRLDVAHYGGVERPEQSYVQLSGISDLDAGEPYFDGEAFHSTVDDRVLKEIVIRRQDLFDAPNLIVVIDGAQDRAFIGSMGGFIRPEANPFHGFQRCVPIEEPTEADKAAIRITAQAIPVSVATGEPLEKIPSAEPQQPGGADMMYLSRYLDRATGTIYDFVSGGIAGYIMRMTSVIRTGIGAFEERPLEPAHP